MTAGTGIRHAEANPSPDEPVHLLQIWITPEKTGLTPGYEQKAIDFKGAGGGWTLIASHDGREGSVTIHQDAGVSVASLEPGGQAAYALPANRHAWLQVTRGAVVLNGHALAAGDGAAAGDEPTLTVRAEGGPAEVLLFDLT